MGADPGERDASGGAMMAVDSSSRGVPHVESRYKVDLEAGNADMLSITEPAAAPARTPAAEAAATDEDRSTMSYDSYPSRREDQMRNAVLIAWITYAVGLATSWVTGPIGFIVALVKRGDAVGTVWESHFDALIRSGVLCFLGYTIGWILVFTVIGAIVGFPLLLVTWIYNIYVVVRGLLRLFDGRPY